MDFMFRKPRKKKYLQVQGTIVSIEPMNAGNGKADGCIMLVSVEDEEGALTIFKVNPNTYVVDFKTLQEGMEAIFFYLADSPVALVFPPQYDAIVVATQIKGAFVEVSYFNNSLINENMLLQLKLNKNVKILNTNNPTYFGNPANHDLVIIFSTTTRSIPAQTTPLKIVVLCN